MRRLLFLLVWAAAGWAADAWAAPDSLLDLTALVPSHRVSLKAVAETPGDVDLIEAGQLGGPLFPTRHAANSIQEKAARRSFGAAIALWNRHDYSKAVALFRKYVRDFPESPWAAEATLHVGCDAMYNGRYTEAERSFQQLLVALDGQTHPGARLVANKARQRLALLKIEQNNLEEAQAHFRTLREESPDWRHRTYAGHWLQRLSRLAAARNALVNCGAEALAHVLDREGQPLLASSVRTNLPASPSGHSLASLVQLARRSGHEAVALALSTQELTALPTPAILRIEPRSAGDKGHYWVLERLQGGTAELFDPQSKRRLRQSLDELGREWSGQALVFSRASSLPGRRLELRELENAAGGCCGLPREEDDLGEPDLDKPPCSCSEGAPAWNVNVISLNLFVTDTPMWYAPPVGPPVRITLSYNSQSAIAHHEPFGNKWQFRYSSYLLVDTAGSVLVVMPDGRRDLFTPDGAGGYRPPYGIANRLTQLAPSQFELRAADDTTYVYAIPEGTASEQPFLTEIRDAYGQKLSFVYDAQVRLTGIADAEGGLTRLAYNAQDLVESATDPFGRTARFEYDASRNLIRITDMGGYSSALSYDANVYLTGISNDRGAWKFRIEPADGINNGSKAYPAPGTPLWQNYRITVTDPLGNSTEYYYNGYAAHTWVVSPQEYMPWKSAFENNYASNVPRTTYHFQTTDNGRRGEISRIEYPEGDYLEYDYDDLSGERTGVTDAHGHHWSYTYNKAGRVTSVTDPRETRTAFRYGTNGADLVSISSALGEVKMTYDARHRLLSRTDRLGQTTTLAYNPFGKLLSIVDALGTVQEMVYDGRQQLVQFKRDGQTALRFTYDAVGRVRTRTDASGFTTTNEYNDLNQLTRVTFPDGKSELFGYAACCPRLLESVTDRAGRTTRLQYDALKRLTQVTTPEGGTIQYRYDANGNRTHIVDPNGNVTQLSYDHNDRLVRKAFPDGTSLGFSYYDLGLLSARTNARGQVTQYTYDANHKLVTVTHSDGTPGVTNTWDAFDRLVSFRDALGRSALTYDAESRLTSVDGPWANDTIAYTRDALGRIVRMAAQGSSPVDYAWDTLNRLSTVGVDDGSYAYSYPDASPFIGELTRPTGASTRFDYDPLGRLAAVVNENSRGELLAGFEYRYNDQEVRAAETVRAGLPVSLQNQLTLAGYNGQNQLVESLTPSRTYAYDADGNLVRGFTPAGEAFLAAYDAESRLQSLTYTNASRRVRRLEFTYDGDAAVAQVREFTDQQLTQTRRFIRSLGRVLQERDDLNTVQRRYVWGQGRGGGIGGLLRLSANGGDYDYAYDGKGNVVLVLDGSEVPVARYGYDPFGVVLARAGTLDQPMQFATMDTDAASGLVAFRYRFYAPATGRFLSRDPLGESAGLNLYAYAGNNPVQRIDPLGLDWAADRPVNTGNAPSVACRGKGSGMRVKWPPGHERLDDCVHDCLEQHENVHMQDAYQFDPNLCNGKDYNINVEYDDPVAAMTSEAKAYVAEIECLNRALQSGNCNKDAVQRRKDTVEEGASQYINLQCVAP